MRTAAMRAASIVALFAASARGSVANVANESLYDRLGGAPAVDAAVDGMYEKILADASLAPIFARVDMGRLKSMQKAFLTMAFGGPSNYTGQSIRDAHAGRGITTANFGAVAGHLSATLLELGVSTKDHDDVMAVAGSVQGDVVQILSPNKQLYDSLGGDAAVAATVDLVYDKIRADKSLGIFAATNEGRLKSMMKSFVTMACGGPSTYTGTTIREAHAGRTITQTHLQSVSGHLSASLHERGASTKDHDGVMALIGLIPIANACPF